MTTLTKPRRFPFTAAQRRILLALACAVGLRMLGLFLVLPVFTLYGLQFTDSRFLVGLAFGAYGLTMALLQLPFGRLSDRIGRKNVLLLGMSVFTLGSFLCAIPGWLPGPWQIATLIFGRLVQGGGAIISTAFATVADRVEPENRSVAMAVLGIPIGAAFVLGVVGGPILAGRLGIASLFWTTGVLGLGTVALLARLLPAALGESRAAAPIHTVLDRRTIAPLHAGGFLTNFFMTSFFFFFPLIATGRHELEMAEYYRLLIPMMVVSGVTTFALSWVADRGFGRVVAAGLFLALLLSGILLFKPQAGGLEGSHLMAVLVPGTLFFVGFSGLEPILPSQVSKAAPENAYGTALGVYNTAQFLGSFAGGSVAGALASRASAGIMSVLAAAALSGFLLMLFRREAPGRARV